MNHPFPSQHALFLFPTGVVHLCWQPEASASPPIGPCEQTTAAWSIPLGSGTMRARLRAGEPESDEPCTNPCTGYMGHPFKTGLFDNDD
jgi:hypothetical protein